LRWIKSFLILMALILAIFALAGPQAGFRWEKIQEKGVDIMIALDCSNSMLAQDIKPNRLEQAKREIIDLIRLMKSDRAGLVAFAGQAILQCPLTLDHETFNIFLRVLTPDYLPVGGTNLAAAMETCYSGFEKGSDTDKAIVLITDGENTAGEGTEEFAKKMAAEGIKIFCIGVGDPTGAPIPDADGGFKKDGQGNIILSRVDDKGLEKIAALTNGRYVRSVAGNMDLDQIYTQDILNTMERKTLTQGKKKVWEQRFQWFLFPCILLLLIEMILPLKKKSARIGLVLLVLALGMGLRVTPARAEIFSSPVKKGLAAYESNSFDQAKTHFIEAQLQSPDDLRHYYNIGAAAYMNNEYEQAEKNFAQAAASPDPDLRHKAMYNLANTRYRLGKLPQAIADYEAILAAFPDDRETRENLEFVKQKQEEEKKQKDSKEKQDSKEDQKDQEDQEDQKGKKDPENQKNSNPDDPGSGQNQDPENKESGNKGQNQKNQNNQGASQENQKPPDANTEKDQNPPGEQAMDKASAEKEDGNKEGQGQSALLESRLNRLEDKPGMGLVPVIQQQTIEKDW
ncbi:MAG: VWA domain-containing protein, partial [Proteobacteria bacterium]|nr:VWA domain-containing protein [Pseudomonadota bacterium]